VEAWSNFYILTGTAAATLIGLMFIALTFGAKLVTPETVGLTRWILSPIIYHFAHAFLLACLALVPDNAPLLVGAAAIITAVYRLIKIPILIKQLKKAEQDHHDIELSDWILDIVIPIILYAALTINGLALLNNLEWSQSGIAFSVVALLFLGFMSAWDMLIWMAMQI